MLRATARVHLRAMAASLGRIARSTAAPEEDVITDGSDVAPGAAPVHARGRPHLGGASRPERGCAGDRSLRAGHRRHDAGDTARAAPSRRRRGERRRCRLDNGFGGVTPNGDYQIRVAGRPGAAGAVGERDRQPARRIRGDRAGRRLHLGREQLLLPADAVAQRSGQRPAERGALPARRGDRRALERHAGADRDTAAYYAIRHGPGVDYVRAHEHAGIESTLTLGIAEDAAIKLSMLRLTNRATARRRLAVTAYVEWTLGVLREHTQHQVHTDVRRPTGTRSSRGTPSTRSSRG